MARRYGGAGRSSHGLILKSIYWFSFSVIVIIIFSFSFLCFLSISYIPNCINIPILNFILTTILLNLMHPIKFYFEGISDQIVFISFLNCLQHLSHKNQLTSVVPCLYATYQIKIFIECSFTCYLTLGFPNSIQRN